MVRSGGSTDYTESNTLRLKQNGRRFADDVFKCIFVNENVCILITNSLKFVQLTINIPALVQLSGLLPIRRQAIIWTIGG